MKSWLETRPAILIAHVRSGSTFLAHCLSTHPQVFCPRSEPLEMRSAFRKAKLSPVQILQIVHGQWGYSVAMCKVTYKQVTDPVLNYLTNRQAKVIHLTRGNLLRTAISAILHTRARRGDLPSRQEHSFEVGPLTRITVDPENVLKQARKLERQIGRMRERLAGTGLPVLELTYAQIVGAEAMEASALPPETNRRICEFLGVQDSPMTSPLRRQNLYPLSLIVENYDVLERAVRVSGNPDWLQDESDYLTARTGEVGDAG